MPKWSKLVLNGQIKSKIGPLRAKRNELSLRIKGQDVHHVFSRVGERYFESYVMPKVKHLSKVMMWAMISGKRTGMTHFLQEYAEVMKVNVL